MAFAGSGTASCHRFFGLSHRVIACARFNRTPLNFHCFLDGRLNCFSPFFRALPFFPPSPRRACIRARSLSRVFFLCYRVQFCPAPRHPLAKVSLLPRSRRRRPPAFSSVDRPQFPRSGSPAAAFRIHRPSSPYICHFRSPQKSPLLLGLRRLRLPRIVIEKSLPHFRTAP